MFKVREWERFQFAIDYQHQQVWSRLEKYDQPTNDLVFTQHKKILERTIPDVLKLSIARRIENNLFSKVCNCNFNLFPLRNILLCLFSDFVSGGTQRNGGNKDTLHSRG